eukprot:503784_1
MLCCPSRSIGSQYHQAIKRSLRILGTFFQSEEPDKFMLVGGAASWEMSTSSLFEELADCLKFGNRSTSPTFIGCDRLLEAIRQNAHASNVSRSVLIIAMRALSAAMRAVPSRLFASGLINIGGRERHRRGDGFIGLWTKWKEFQIPSENPFIGLVASSPFIPSRATTGTHSDVRILYSGSTYAHECDTSHCGHLDDEGSDEENLMCAANRKHKSDRQLLHRIKKNVKFPSEYDANYCTKHTPKD